MADPKRILIVDDSRTCREYLRFILEKAGDFRVTGVAVDGEDAVRKAHLLKPDVITMDIRMPRMNGIEASRRILEFLPVPIVIVSDLWETGEVQRAFEAMEIGALAGVRKPAAPGHPDADDSSRLLVRTVRLMAEIPVVRRRKKAPPPGTPPPRGAVAGISAKVVAVGASTGGPPVLKEIISRLPSSFTVPILVVQHISPGFLPGMLEWLRRSCTLGLRVPERGEIATQGNVYFAPDGHHMGLGPQGAVILTDGPPEYGVRPSVSFLFRSVAASFGRDAVGVLLTGMGKDGALELRNLREQGALTLIQDERSAVVFGMPGEALRLGAARCVLSPSDIAATLMGIGNVHRPQC